MDSNVIPNICKIQNLSVPREDPHTHTQRGVCEGGVVGGLDSTQSYTICTLVNYPFQPSQYYFRPFYSNQ